MRLMNNRQQERPKMYFIIIAITFLVSALAAILLPIPRKFKWLFFYMLWVVLAFIAILVYSKFLSGKKWRK